MPAEQQKRLRGAPTIVTTKLAALRIERGITQQKLARATGIPFHTYWKLEAGMTENPRIGHLMNCAIALGVELEDVLEEKWHKWMPLPGARRPPDREKLWHTHK